MITIASWNVNSLTVRLSHLLEWMATNPQIDVLCIQETKTEDAKFPADVLQAAGYHVAFIGQKTYNGVAVVSRLPISDAQYVLPGVDDTQKRLIAVTIDASKISSAVDNATTENNGNSQNSQNSQNPQNTNNTQDPNNSQNTQNSQNQNATRPQQIRVVGVYVPNGQDLTSDKFNYKLNWLAALNEWLRQEIKRYPYLVIGGDYNIAPTDSDTHDPLIWRDQILCSPAERNALQQILDIGFYDSFRLFEQPPKLFSWWDYRLQGFRRNKGLRIDLILISEALKPYCTAAGIDKSLRKLPRPSDHTPVWVALSTPSAAVAPAPPADPVTPAVAQGG